MFCYYYNIEIALQLSYFKPIETIQFSFLFEGENEVPVRAADLGDRRFC